MGEPKVKVEHVIEAFELQFNSVRQVDQANIDLGFDDAEGDAAAPAQPDAPQDDEQGNDPKVNRRKAKISFAEYQRIGQMLARHLSEMQDQGKEVTEEDLTNWYMETVEEEIDTENQLYEQQHKVQKIIRRMIDKDHVILVSRASENPMKPEERILVKHPNYYVGETIVASSHIAAR